MKGYLRFLGRNKLYTSIEGMGLSLALAFLKGKLTIGVTLTKVE